MMQEVTQDPLYKYITVFEQAVQEEFVPAVHVLHAGLHG